jgi:hypothetical protein
MGMLGRTENFIFSFGFVAAAKRRTDADEEPPCRLTTEDVRGVDQARIV